MEKRDNIVLQTLSKVDEKTFVGIKFLINYLSNCDGLNNTNTLKYFMLNVRNIPKLPTTTETWKKIRETGDTRYAITTAFDWVSSPEGYEFWSNIDSHFREEYDKITRGGMDYSVIIINNPFMKSFVNEYITPFEPKDGSDSSISTHQAKMSIIPDDLTKRLHSFLISKDSNREVKIINDILVKNKCAEQFFNNLRNRPKYLNYEEKYEEYLNGNKSLGSIVFWAFKWSSTDEGVIFWSKISTAIEDAIDDQKPKETNKPSVSGHTLNSNSNLLYNEHAYGYRSCYYSSGYGYNDYYSSVPKEITSMTVNKNYITVSVIG